MSFGDVCLLFGTLLSLGIVLPGLLVAWALLCPSVVERASIRLARTPGRSFFLGLGCLVAGLPPLGLLFKVGAWIGLTGLCALLACASVGAAGLAGLMGDRLRRDSPALSPGGALLRGAVALELAAVFPLIGWFIILPVAFICGLGAACFALLRWLPRPVAVAATPQVPWFPDATPAIPTALPAISTPPVH